MDDADPTGWKLYRVVYDHDRSGWCVVEERSEHQLIFSYGPFDNESEARAKMRSMNESQGVELD